MGTQLAFWFDEMSDTSKAVLGIITIIMFTITCTLGVAQQIGLPARVTAVEAAVDTLRNYAAENRAGIREVRKNTETILCIMSLPSTIPPPEARLRCP